MKYYYYPIVTLLTLPDNALKYPLISQNYETSDRITNRCKTKMATPSMA